MYRVEPLLDRDNIKDLPDWPESHIEGQLGNYLVVSVPVTTSFSKLAEIRQKMMEVTGGPVLVITHNMSLLKATKLPPKEASQVIKNAEDYAEARDRAIEEARMGAEQELESLGGGPGVCEPGDSGSGEVTDRGDSVSGAEAHEDGEGRQEGDEESPSSV